MKKNVTSVIIRCLDCHWDTQDYITGQKAAAEHARRSGHEVRGEICVSVFWPRTGIHAKVYGRSKSPCQPTREGSGNG